jgi:hypothetical protein
MVCGRDEKEGGGDSLYSGDGRIGGGSVGNNASTDGHEAMREEALTTPPEKFTVTSLDQR